MTANGRRLDAQRLDEQLCAVAAGDKQAFEQLYQDTRVAVYGFVLSILKNRQDAEDALHDCYLRIYTAAQGYRSMGQPAAWVFTIARNRCLQMLRDRRETPEEEIFTCEPADASAEDRLMLNECMQSLSPEERQIVVLHAVSGFKHREIASFLSLPLSTVLSKYHRAMQKLRTQL